MHKFMRTIGFGGCDSDLEMDKIMRKLAKTASKTAVLERNDHPTLYDLRAELAPGMGIAMIGQMTEKGTFKREYAFPYVTGSDISSTAECSIQRHAERETYAGLLDEYRVGISLIFYMTNSIEYRSRRSKRLPVLAKNICLSGLASQGKILLPVKKTPKQAEDLKQAARKRGSLLEAARRGDEQAIETLTVEDIDLYSMVTKRIIKEDMYSIIETCFMPSGIECDQYSIIGNILSVNLVANDLTNEEIYRLRIECNDIKLKIPSQPRGYFALSISPRKLQAALQSLSFHLLPLQTPQSLLQMDVLSYL